jgi:hypothetical protein
MRIDNLISAITENQTSNAEVLQKSVSDLSDIMKKYEDQMGSILKNLTYAKESLGNTAERLSGRADEITKILDSYTQFNPEELARVISRQVATDLASRIKSTTTGEYAIETPSKLGQFVAGTILALGLATIGYMGYHLYKQNGNCEKAMDSMIRPLESILGSK